METILIVALVFGLLLMAGGIFLGRARRGPVGDGGDAGGYYDDEAADDGGDSGSGGDGGGDGGGGSD